MMIHTKMKLKEIVHVQKLKTLIEANGDPTERVEVVKKAFKKAGIKVDIVEVSKQYPNSIHVEFSSQNNILSNSIEFVKKLSGASVVDSKVTVNLFFK